MSQNDAFTIEQARKAIRPIINSDKSENRLAVMFRGPHGIGKSDLIYQIAKEQGYDDEHIIERRASQMVEGDLIGMPDNVDDLEYTKWKPPEWLHKACQEPCLLFFDEVDRAMVSVRQGLFELTGSRKLYGNELHEDTIIFSAINGGEGVTEYTVGEMDPAELDRWYVIDFMPSHQEWLDWAGDNDINRFVFEFISNNPDHLEHDDKHDPGKVYPSRRSWDRFSRLINETWDDTEKPDPEWIFTHGLGHIGHETAMKFADFVRQYKDQFSIEDILNDKDGSTIEEVADRPMTVHNAICEQFASKYTGEELDDDQVENLANYIVVLDDEIAMSLYKSIDDYDCREAVFEVEHDEVGEVGDYFLEMFESDKDLQEAEAFGGESQEAEAEAGA
jgi:hypothetical protein